MATAETILSCGRRSTRSSRLVRAGSASILCVDSRETAWPGRRGRFDEDTEEAGTQPGRGASAFFSAARSRSARPRLFRWGWISGAHAQTIRLDEATRSRFARQPFSAIAPRSRAVGPPSYYWILQDGVALVSETARRRASHVGRRRGHTRAGHGAPRSGGSPEARSGSAAAWVIAIRRWRPVTAGDPDDTLLHHHDGLRPRSRGSRPEGRRAPESLPPRSSWRQPSTRNKLGALLLPRRRRRARSREPRGDSAGPSGAAPGRSRAETLRTRSRNSGGARDLRPLAAGRAVAGRSVLPLHRNGAEAAGLAAQGRAWSCSEAG